MAPARRAEILRHPGFGRHRRHRKSGRHLPRRTVRGRTCARRHLLYLYGDHAPADHHGRAVRRHRRRDHLGGRTDPPARRGRRIARKPELRRKLALRRQAHGPYRHLSGAGQQRRGRGRQGQGRNGAARRTSARRHHDIDGRGHHDQHRRRHQRHLHHAHHSPRAGDLHHLPLHSGLARHGHSAGRHPRVAGRRLRALSAAGVLDQHHFAAGTGAGDRSGGGRRHRCRGGRAGQYRQRDDPPAPRRSKP